MPTKEHSQAGTAPTGPKQDDAAIIKMALDLGATEAKMITQSQVTVSGWVRFKCQYGCPNFGKRLTCPPFTPPIDEVKRILSEYKKILIVKFEQTPIPREMSADDFIKEFNTRQRTVNDISLKIEKQLMLKGHYKVFALQPGMCNRCTECVVQPGKCLHPADARPAPEALAIDMFETVKNAGWDIEVKTDTGQSWTNYALILVE